LNAVPILRTSERKAFKRCPAQWWWAYREGLRPRGSEATPLWFGTGFHLALEHWYVPGTKRGVHPAETWREYAKDALHTIKVSDATEERVAEYEDGAKLGEILCEEYVRHWGDDSHMEIIQAEQTFNLPIPWPKEAGRQGVYETEDGAILVDYNGKYDAVYRDLNDGLLKLLETKTARSIVTTHLNLDDQAGSYWAIAALSLRRMGLMGPKEQLHGITYNFIRKGLPDDRPRDAEGYACNKPTKSHYVAALTGVDGWTAADLGKKKVDELEGIAAAHFLVVLGERSKVQPPPLFQRHQVDRTSKERNSQLRRIQDEAVHMQAVRDGLLPIIKNPSRDCSFCQFRAMCELQERQGAWEDFKRIAFKVEDPYADYRKSTDE
jgi:Zierdtviridae exonuclease